jgi:hypothetical protein
MHEAEKTGSSSSQTLFPFLTVSLSFREQAAVSKMSSSRLPSKSIRESENYSSKDAASRPRAITYPLTFSLKQARWKEEVKCTTLSNNFQSVNPLPKNYILFVACLFSSTR